MKGAAFCALLWLTHCFALSEHTKPKSTVFKLRKKNIFPVLEIIKVIFFKNQQSAVGISSRLQVKLKRSHQRSHTYTLKLKFNAGSHKQHSTANEWDTLRNSLFQKQNFVKIPPKKLFFHKRPERIGLNSIHQHAHRVGQHGWSSVRTQTAALFTQLCQS